jgi:hypothetical protein
VGRARRRVATPAGQLARRDARSPRVDQIRGQNAVRPWAESTLWTTPAAESLDPAASCTVPARAEPPDLGRYLDEVVVDGPPRRGPAGTWQGRWARRVRELTGVGRAATRHGFVLTRAQVRALGVTDAEFRRLIRAGVWWSPRFGIVSVLGRPPDDRGVAALRATAAALARKDAVVSHHSAAALHGLPTLVVPPRPELTRRDHASTGRRDQVHVRRAVLADGEVAEWFGAPVTSIARTVADLARTAVQEGLIAADAALHEGLATAADLAEAVSRCAGQPGARSARTAIALASPLAESPLESLTRLRVVEASLPTPELQVWITDPADGWRCRVDLLWPEHRLIVEADGRTKYRDDELWREKLRQERLERLGYRVVRVMWRDVMYHPNEMIMRIRCALHAARPTG